MCMKYQFMRKQTTDSLAIRIVMLIMALLFLLPPASAVGQEKNTSDASSHISKYILESSELESGVYKVHAKCINPYNTIYKTAIRQTRLMAVIFIICISLIGRNQ